MRRAIPLLPLLLAASPSLAEDLAPRLRAGLVRVEVTAQPYDATTPWNKQSPRAVAGRGFVVEPGVVLTTAANVKDAVLLELSVANSARRYPAGLKHADARSGLALLEIEDAEFAASLAPLEIGDPVKLDDDFDIYQVGNDNTVERSTGRVVRADANGAQLTLHLKTTCSDPGTGQVALRGGKVAGLLAATVPNRQEGTLLSVETIRRYLDDFRDGTFHGAPGGGIWIQQLLRPDLRAYYGLQPGQHGIAVSRVMPGRTGDGSVRAGDVILSVDGYALDDEGKFDHEVHGRLGSIYLFQGRRCAGDKVPVRLLREGAERDAELELKAWPDEEQRVPQSADGRPVFLVVAGLVILELTQDVAAEIRRSTGGVILRRYRERAAWDLPDGRHRIVYMDRVLADRANKGYEEAGPAVVESVNGRPITRISDVAEALTTPQGAFHVIRFEGTVADFAVEAAKLAEIDARIAAAYKVALPRWLKGDAE
ncbi:MAG: PDZ domain-containing protein [Planctomycetota bacterium]